MECCQCGNNVSVPAEIANKPGAATICADCRSLWTLDKGERLQRLLECLYEVAKTGANAGNNYSANLACKQIICRIEAATKTRSDDDG